MFLEIFFYTYLVNLLYTFASAGKFAGNRAKAMRLKDTHKHHNQNLFRIRDNTK